MYACITGKVLEQNTHYVVIEAAGIGYMIFCSALTQDKLHSAQSDVKLFLEQWVRENEIRLYGFFSQRERQWFRLLISIQGVGAKHAMALLSIFTPEDLFQIIIEKNEKLLTQADGVGAKLAKRMIVELFEKVSKMEEEYKSNVSSFATHDSHHASSHHVKNKQELQDALKSLGFDMNMSKKMAYEAIQALGDEADMQQLIKYALKEISR